MAFNHADNATFARLAARRYLSFSAGVARNSTRSVAGSVDGGLPLGRLSMPELCTVQIMLDKPLSSLYSVRTLTRQGPQMNDLRRLDAALNILRDHGWTNTDIDRAFSGLRREDAIEQAERHAKAALGLDDAEAA